MTSTSGILENVSRETLDRLKVYHDLVIKWQGTINLVAHTHDLWNRHIIDSAQLFSLLTTPDRSLVDLGSGGGFPGLVLAILGVREVHLVESDTRKCAFLREAARLTGSSNVAVHHTRIEMFHVKHCDVVTSRALAPLTDLLSIANALSQPNTTCLFPKGKNYRIEMEEAAKAWHFDAEIHPSITSDAAVILAIQHIRRSHA